MEFVHHDGNKLNKVYINTDCTYIDINEIREIVSKVGLFTEQEGKFETLEYIIKYSKGTLYLYDKRHNLLGTYKFSKFYKKENNQENSINSFSIKSNNDQENLTLVNKFILKKDVYIELYINDKGKYFIINSENTQEKVIEFYIISNGIVYITENNKLEVNTKRHSKWNGIPIGKIM